MCVIVGSYFCCILQISGRGRVPEPEFRLEQARTTFGYVQHCLAANPAVH